MEPDTLTIGWWLVRAAWMGLGAVLAVVVVAALRASRQVKVTLYDATDHGRLQKASERVIHMQDLQDGRYAGL